jgi:hypothetical protein
MDFHDNPPKASKKSFVSSSDAASTLDHPTIIYPMSYWDSNEARILFATRDGETALQSIDNQIEILQKANKMKTSYLEVISTNGEREDVKEILSKFQKHVLHQKCQLLCLSLWFAKENMNKWT